MKIGIIFLLLFLVGCQVKETTSSGAVISGHLPTSAIFSVTTPLNVSYVSTSIIPFTLTFPKIVTVTGTPRLLLNIGGTIRYADFVSGSGSSALLFHYTVQAAENDSDGIVLSSTIDLNGGALKYDANNCNTTITPPNLSTVLVDSVVPTIILATVPSNGTYISGAVLDFSFKFSEKVTVTGTPKLPINLTSGAINANYFSGSGSDTLLFRYTVTSSDVDVDGISLQSLNLNSGTVQDVVHFNADLTYTSPNTSAIFIAGNTPSITSITLPSAGRYTTGQNVDFTVNFDQSVFVTLAPRLAITTSAGTVYANFLSGGGTNALVFRYTVASGDYDTDGIALVSPLEANGGAIQNITMTSNAQLNFTPPSASSITVDGLDPVISSITAPTSKWYLLAENLDFTVNYSTPVVVTGVPKLSLVVGSSSVVANYLSGSGTGALKFRYTVISTNLDTDGVQTTSPLVLSTGTIKDSFGDSAGLSFTPTSHAGVLVDTISPAISSVSGPASASYTSAQNLDFSFVFSENVTVIGVPSIPLTIGSSSKAAVYFSGSGSNTLVFRYTVASADQDLDGIVNSSPLGLNAGSIKDAAGNSLASLSFTPPSTAGVVIYGSAPSIVSVTAPSNSTYKTSQNVDFVVNFSQSVNVTGSPRLELDLGGTTAYANYVSGSATSNLTFRYVVQANDKDINGLALVSPLALNSGTIADSSLNNASLTFTLPTTTGVLIDGVDLVIASIVPPADKTYAENEAIDFTLNYNNSAIVTGFPRMELTVGSSTKYATYFSGSGSSALVFRYVVLNSDLDSDGVTTVGPSLALNSGTVKDEFTDNANLAFVAANYPNKKVDGIAPYISLVTSPPSGSYLLADNVDFTITTSEIVNVTGFPRINLTVGSTGRYATYLSGSGSTSLTFRYSVLSGDLDSDGISSSSPVDLNSGTLKDQAGNVMNPLTFTPPNSAGVLVNGVAPYITSLQAPSNGRYTTGQNVDFTVNYDQSVFVTLSPRLAITTSSGTVYANYLSGGGSSNLIFRYTVASNQYDIDGITLVSPLETNGGAIQNISMTTNAQLVFTSPDTSLILIDGLDPLISSVTPPANKWYVLSENLDFIVNYSSPVLVTGTPSISLTVGSSSVNANYLSGSGTGALTFRYVVIAADLDGDGVATSSPLVLNAGTIKDAFGDTAGLTFTAPTTTGVKVDTIAPTISSISAPTSATYFNNQNIDFSLVFSENISVTGIPSLSLTVGATSKTAVYVSGTGTNTLIFRYSVASGDLDNDGITSSSPILLNGGTLKDAAGNALSGLTFTPPSTSGVLVDGTLASISSITPPTGGTYKTATNVDFIANFSRSVNVTGSPKLVLDVGGMTVYANYLSGSATSSLTFRYIVQAGNKDLNGLALTSPLDLISGTITDSSGNNATLTFIAPNTSAVLIDGIDLLISSITPPADKTYANTENLDFTVNYNNTAIVSGTPRIQLAVGVVNQYATYVSGSGSSALVFRYTVGASDLDTDGVTTVGSNLDLNSGTIKDEFTDNADLAFIATNYPNKKVDGASPTIASVSAPTSGTYAEAENINFTVTTSENVNVTGSPRISLTVGSTARYATYISGSGTSSLVFRYSVPFGDLDNDGIANASPLDLNAGTIKDLAGNSLSPLTFTPANSSGVLVNGVAPFISSVTPPSNGTYATSGNLDFIVNYSGAVDVVGSPKLSLDIGGVSVQATYLSGSGSSALTFRYTIIVGDIDSNGIAISSPLTLNGGTIKNSSLTNASLSFTPPSTTSVLVDGIDIVISTITPPADSTYKIGANLDFTVNYNYAATVTGTPRLQLTVGASTLYATYVSGTGTSAHLFRYSVASGEVDSDGISTVGPAVDLNGGTVKDSFGDNANLNFTGTNFPNKKVDGIRPTVASMAVSSNKTYLSGENIDFTATYSEVVTITGSPRLSLTVGITSRYATYVSGSGTNAIIFRHTVEVGDNDNDGITAATLIDLNSGTVSDSPGNTQTNLSFTPPTLTGVLIGGVSPTILSIDPPASQTYMLGAQLNFTVNFSENVTITGTPTLSLNVGGTTVQASYVSGSGASAIVFRYTTLLNHYDGDGVATVSPVALAGGTIKSTLSSANAILTFTGSTKVGVLVDAVLPKITSITLPTNFSYQSGHGIAARQYLQFTVNTDKAVTVIGAPRLILSIGTNNAAYAAYVSAGSTSTALIFKYNVATTDLDLDGVTFGNSNNLDLNGGTIKGSTVANNLDPALGTNSMTKIFVVPTYFRNWYDLSDSSYLNVSSGNLNSMSDKVGSMTLTNAAPKPYFATGFNGVGNNGYVSCSLGSYYDSSIATSTPKVLIVVYKAPAAIVGNQYLFFVNSGTAPLLRFFSTNSWKMWTGRAANFYRGGAWTTSSLAEYLNLWNASTAGVMGISWDNPITAIHRFCGYDGALAEAFLLNAQPTATEMAKIESYINTRYGLNFSP